MSILRRYARLLILAAAISGLYLFHIDGVGLLGPDEPRYAAFKAYQQGQVWVYERRETATGANDYWSRSVTRPDLALADLVKIFHPTLTPEHAFEWYMPVPAR